MYTYKFVTDDQTIFGPICHNYATAYENAKNFLLHLKTMGYDYDEAPEINKPFKVELLGSNSKGLLVVGRIIFVEECD